VGISIETLIIRPPLLIILITIANNEPKSPYIFINTGLSFCKPQNGNYIKIYFDFEFFNSQLQQLFLKCFATNEKEKLISIVV
jgi:hypothetical protein